MKRYETYKDSGVQWLGEIPTHWDVKRLKSVISEHFSGSWGEDEKHDGLDRLCIRIADFDFDSQTVSDSAATYRHYTEKQIQSGSLLNNDLLLEKSGGGDKTPVGRVVVYRKTKSSEDLFANFCECLRVRKNQSSKYIAYLLKVVYIKTMMRQFYKQTTGLQNIDIPDYLGMKIILPPLIEQEAIVAFLDEKTAEIDGLVSQVEREIELLKEYKQAMITHVVTRGLNPNAPMKPSGISWIGDIPQHWNVRNLFQVATSYYESNKGMKNQNLLSLSYGAIILKDINKTDGLLPASFETYQIVHPNIIVLRLTDLQNDHKSLRVGISKYNGIVTSAYEALKVREPNNADYIYYQLHVNDIHKVFYGMGNGLRQNLNYDGMRYMKLVVPPAEEQQEIVDHIDRKTKEIDHLVVELTYQVEYLKEYKQRLIADVVTGKINVQQN